MNCKKNKYTEQRKVKSNRKGNTEKMYFEVGFEDGQRVNVTESLWESVPEIGGCTAEGSRSHSGETGWRCSEKLG